MIVRTIALLGLLFLTACDDQVQSIQGEKYTSLKQADIDSYEQSQTLSTATARPGIINFTTLRVDNSQFDSAALIVECKTGIGLCISAEVLARNASNLNSNYVRTWNPVARVPSRDGGGVKGFARNRRFEFDATPNQIAQTPANSFIPSSVSSDPSYDARFYHSQGGSDGFGRFVGWHQNASQQRAAQAQLAAASRQLNGLSRQQDQIRQQREQNLQNLNTIASIAGGLQSRPAANINKPRGCWNDELKCSQESIDAGQCPRCPYD